MSNYPSGDELLGILVQAERRLDGPARETFRVHPDRRRGAQVEHPGLRDPDDPESQRWMNCNKQDLVDLSESKYVKIEKRKSMTVPGRKETSYEWWEIHVTPRGFDRVDRLAARTEGKGTDQAGTLDWSVDVLPVLIAACEA